MNASFLDKIRRDYPDLKFVTGRKFAFRPPKTVVVGPEEPDDSLLLLHELGHAILEHREFGTNVMRLKMERAAWEIFNMLCRHEQMTVLCQLPDVEAL